MKKTTNIIIRIAVIVIVCVVTVILLPKSGNFRYEYQLGAPWRYETLKSPFDFPVYKADAELESERNKIVKEQVPIFNLNESIKTIQVNKFNAAVSRLGEEIPEREVNRIQRELENIYNAGIVQLPEAYNNNNVKSIKVVSDNIGTDRDIKKVYSLKSAYTALTQYINNLAVPEEVKESILNLDLNNFIAANLEFDESKTNVEVTNKLQNISLTQGMIHAGELIVNKDEMVTQEKIRVLNSLKTEYRHNAGSIGNRIRIIAGLVLLTLAGVFVFASYFYFFRKRFFYKKREFIFLFSSFLLTVALASVSYYYDISIYAIPTLFLIIIANILIDKRSAFYLLLGTSMLTAYFAPNSYMYLFMQLTAGTVAIFSLSQLQRRGQLFLAIVLIFLTYSVIYIAFTFIQEGEITFSHAFTLVFFLINCLLLSISYLLIYIFERIFGFISELTLIELSNPNHPALRELTRKAPGTFQHSLNVANLAEEAIYRIGGSPLLVRTGALYHDIGKSAEPIFFIENQAGGVNPHANLDFDESARHILGHVEQGIALAKKFKLPEPIVDFIRTHHGKSKAKFFYHSFRNKYPDKEVDETLFTYQGPDPSSKETAVLMMADAVEAASRSLPEKTEENLTQLVNDIIDTQLKEGRFTNADITFKDITTIKSVFVETLSNFYHSRVAYPKLDKEEEEEEITQTPNP